MAYETVIITADPECSIYEVNDIGTVLMEAFQTQKTVTMDLRQVQYTDAAFLQLLLSAKKQAQLEGVEFRLESPGACVSLLAEKLAMSAILFSHH
jgi:anti-anti-sigma factor